MSTQIDTRPIQTLEKDFRTFSFSKSQNKSAITKFSKNRFEELKTPNALTPRCVGYVEPKSKKNNSCIF